MKKIVAFLQNQYFNDVASAKRTLDYYIEHGKDSSDFVRDMLFFGCQTGRRLRAAFGEEFCYENIVWENASPLMGSKPSDKFPPDLEHIWRILVKHKPDIVILFGGEAAAGFYRAIQEPAWDCGYKVFSCPHPAHRDGSVIGKLKKLALDVKKETRYEQQES